VCVCAVCGGFGPSVGVCRGRGRGQVMGGFYIVLYCCAVPDCSGLHCMVWVVN